MKEVLPGGSENPQVNSSVLFKGQLVSVLNLDGKALRMGTPALLGKRFVCAQPIETITKREVVDPATKETKIVVDRQVEYVPGSISNTDGERIYLGCGTEILCVKPSPEKVGPRCCDIPMTLVEPKVLPSAD